MRRSQQWPAGVFWAMTLISGLAQDDTKLEPFVVTAARPTPWEGSVGYSGETLNREEMEIRPGNTLSDQLGGRNGFRLFRRQSSLAAHPTTQAASLRVAGPNGASRTAVYLDGVPLNDPFGGWVPWTAIHGLELGRTSIVQPSGIDPWGNVSLGGTVWLEGRRDDPYWSFDGSWGNVVDHQMASAFLIASPEGATRIRGSWSSLQSSGYHVIRSDQRGPVDRKATVASDAVMLGVEHDFASPWSLSTEIRYHDERRGNGTPLAENTQESWQARVSLIKERSADAWESRLTGYWQARDFSSVFTSVNADRDAENAVLDQFDVPSVAAGLTWRSRHWVGDDHEFLFGLDGRFLEGETNERFRDLGDGFTRRRRAGGQRWETGAVAEHTWRVRPTLALKSSVRLDYTVDRLGEEKTWDLTTGQSLTDDDFGSDRDWQFAGRLALEWEPTDQWSLHASGFTGTRQPTLNELYRPFRVGNDITLANAGLESERLWGAALGTRWQPEDRFAVSVEGFWHRMDDAIANVTLADGGQTVAPWGFIPPGGSGRQRRNLEEISILGLQTRLTVELDAGWALELGYLLTDSKIERSSDQPELEGRTLAQMPTHQAYTALSYDTGQGFYTRAEARWNGRVFDDDLNERELDAYFVVNAQIGWRWTENVSCFLSLENLFDEEIEVSRSGAGLIGVGAPRLAQLGFRLDY